MDDQRAQVREFLTSRRPPGVLEGLARALQLDEAERTHLFDLARAAEPGLVRQRRLKTAGVTAGVQLVLDAITDAPAWIRNARTTPGSCT